MYTRIQTLELPLKQSAFLWGARKTGKSTFLRAQFKDSLYFDFLKTDEYLKYLKAPYLLREEIQALNKKQLLKPIIIDEVQKIPAILDEVHWMIENLGVSFILCGSSARKLKSKGVNLLGGRAWKYNFFPLVYSEIQDFDLLKVLNHGTIPSHYLSNNIRRSFKSYIEDYLIQEIQSEGLVRNLPLFARFFDIIPFTAGEMVNYANVARDCGIDAKTVKSYFDILVDTLIGYYVHPYTKKNNRRIITSLPKFYLFDVGLATNLAKKKFETLSGIDVGKALENYILQELVAYNSIAEKDCKIQYWRTKTGIEVDFIIDKRIAIEIKSSNNLHIKNYNGLKAINEEIALERSIIVCNENKIRKLRFKKHEIDVLPISIFLEKLWLGEIF